VDEVGADIDTIAIAMGVHRRISLKFLHPGSGYSGSCLPKDTRALVLTGEQYRVEMSLVRVDVNRVRRAGLRYCGLRRQQLQGRLVWDKGQTAVRAETAKILRRTEVSREVG
jgi:UDPglucose 6-dehydrogenase